jgi:hypothetical protein
MALQPQEYGMSLFDRYIGIDYSGTQTPKNSLPVLRVFIADGSGTPLKINQLIYTLYNRTPVKIAIA